GTTKIVLQIWDINGDDRFRFLLPIFSRGSSGGIFMFDITKPYTLENGIELLEIFKTHTVEEGIEAPIIMVGGKSDFNAEKSISENKIKDLMNKFNIVNYLECSSKTGENVELVFEILTKNILEYKQLI
ncbi:MAG: Rab family GTPase, partial [Candidatus Hermodarchaeota archaeon]